MNLNYIYFFHYRYNANKSAVSAGRKTQWLQLYNSWYTVNIQYINIYIYIYIVALSTQVGKNSPVKKIYIYIYTFFFSFWVYCEKRKILWSEKDYEQTWVEKQLKHSGLEHIFIRNGSHHWQFYGSRKAWILKFSLPVRMINSLYFLLQPKWRDTNACRLSDYVTAFLSRYVLTEWWLLS